MSDVRRVVLLVVMPLVVVVTAVVVASVAERTGGGEADEPGGAVATRPLVTLIRYGGVDGGTDRVEVDSTGDAVVSRDRSSASREQTLSATDFSALRNALERSQIATLKRNYLDPKAEIAFQYDVTYQGVTVTADAGVVPRQLQPVVDILDRLLA